MRAKLNCDRLFFNWKAATLLGVAAALAVCGFTIDHTKIAHTQLVLTASWPLMTLAVAMSLGSITLFLAMWLYWVKCDGSLRWYRSIWFCVLLLGFFSGVPQVLYYIAVYLPGVRKRLQEEKGERSA